jgi:hypothetical protein
VKYLALTLLMVAGAVHAQGFVDEPTCYSWEGGHKSAGSFSKCPQPWVVKKVAAPAPPAPVVAAPVLQSNVCPPQITVIPEPRKPKPIIKRKPKPVIC